MSTNIPPPSAYQRNIHEKFTNSRENLLIQACAGSGKTTLLEQLCGLTTMLDMVVALCFNKVIAEEFKKRLPFHVKSCTMHSLGYEIVRGNVAKTKMDTNKRDNVLNDVAKQFGLSREEKVAVAQDVNWLIQMAYATMTNLDDMSAVLAMIDACGGEIDNPERAAEIAHLTMNACRAQHNVIGFDDMIDHPLYHKYSPLKFKVVLVDEAQDLNLQQIAFIRYIAAEDARIVAVGDRFQSIYQWRGADTKAMDRIKREFNCTEMPLSISYRCPRSVVDHARQITETIEVSSSAIDGEIDMRTAADYDALIPTLVPGTMVVCRINAPLMPLAMSLIRAGKKAVIRGRDIGSGLTTLIERIEAALHKKNPTMLQIPKDQFMKALLEDARKRVRKALDQDKVKSAAFVIDQYETIAAAFHDVSSVPELKDVVKRIFADEGDGVILSSVHRAKGLEAPDVVILGPELMPHPLAFYSPNQDEAMQQERNLQYVAVTRAKRKLTYQPLKEKTVTASADAIMAFLGEGGYTPKKAKVVNEDRAPHAADAAERGLRDEEIESQPGYEKEA